MAPMFDRLCARSPYPVQVRTASVPYRRVRSQPYWRWSVLILPSLPVRHLTARRKAGRCSVAWRALPGLPLRDDHLADAQVVQVVFDGLLAVAAVGGDGAGRAGGALDDPADGGCHLPGLRRGGA